MQSGCDGRCRLELWRDKPASTTADGSVLNSAWQSVGCPNVGNRAYAWQSVRCSDCGGLSCGRFGRCCLGGCSLCSNAYANSDGYTCNKKESTGDDNGSDIQISVAGSAVAAKWIKANSADPNAG